MTTEYTPHLGAVYRANALGEDVELTFEPDGPYWAWTPEWRAAFREREARAQ